jgi:hypothetical protein
LWCSTLGRKEREKEDEEGGKRKKMNGNVDDSGSMDEVRLV